MPATTARPRVLTIVFMVLLLLQLGLVAQGMREATGSATRPPWVVALNGGMMVALLCGSLASTRYPRAAWVLLGVSIACLVTSVIAVRQLAG